MLSGIAWLFIFLHQPPKYQVFGWVSSLYRIAINNVTITTLGFILIVSLIILL